MSLYAQYLKERRNGECIENEYGFITYHILKEENMVYIEDVYIIPEARQSHKAVELWDKVLAITKEMGINKVLGSVDLNTPTRDISIKGLYARGMKISHYKDNMLYFIIEV
jgi:hypothetical protein